MDRTPIYTEALLEARGLIAAETDCTAVLANLAALLKEHFNFIWVGFYRANAEQSELILGPFQGPIACTRIKRGPGVCGAAWEQRQSLIVPDVHQFPGHIACNSASKSEVVVPFFRSDKLFCVLDIDSTNFADFSEVDRQHLEKLRDMFLESWEERKLFNNPT